MTMSVKVVSLERRSKDELAQTTVLSSGLLCSSQPIAVKIVGKVTEDLKAFSNLTEEFRGK